MLREAVETALSRADWPAAESLVAGELRDRGPSPELAECRFLIARERGEWIACEEIAAETKEAYPDGPAWIRMSVVLLERAQRYEDALRLAQLGLDRFADDILFLRRAANCARLLRRHDVQMGYLERLAQLGDNPARRWEAIARLQIVMFDGDAALTSVDLAASAGAPAAVIALLRARALEKARRHGEAIEAWGGILADPHGEARSEAEASLRKQANYVRANDNHEIAADREALIACGANGGPDVRRKISSSLGDIAAIRDTSSRSAVLIFGGVSMMMGAAPPSLPNFLKTHRINALSFSDRRGRFTMRGVETLGASYDETQDELTRLLASWSVERLFAVGYSAGGYPAMRHGLELGARRILLVSGYVDLSPSEPLSPLASRLLAELGDMRVDMRSHAARHANRTDVIVAYASDVREDVWQAEQLARLPNVTLRPIASAQHAIGLNQAEHDALIGELLADAV